MSERVLEFSDARVGADCRKGRMDDVKLALAEFLAARQGPGRRMRERLREEAAKRKGRTS